MNIIRCAIVVDEPFAIELLEDYIRRMPQLQLVATFDNPLQAFQYLQGQVVDLLFLDIEMPELNGMQLSGMLDPALTKVIFTTAYREYAVESYELEVVDYLLKPITFTRFFKAINKYLNQKQDTPVTTSPPSSTSPSRTEDQFLYVNANKKRIKVWFQDVEYIESLKDYIRIHQGTGSITTKEKISEFEQKLPAYFLRIHRSFIVNTKKITAYTAHDVEIKEKEIPIGGSYKKEVFKKLGG